MTYKSKNKYIISMLEYLERHNHDGFYKVLDSAREQNGWETEDIIMYLDIIIDMIRRKNDINTITNSVEIAKKLRLEESDYKSKDRMLRRKLTQYQER